MPLDLSLGSTKRVDLNARYRKTDAMRGGFQREASLLWATAGPCRMSVVARLEPGVLNPQLELAQFMEQAHGDGAIVSFVGLARPETTKGDAIEALVLEYHPTLTRRSLEAIAVACEQRFDVRQILVVHRCGAVSAGEPIVLAAAASAHRRAAFDAVDYLMDRLKTEAIFWKREIGDDGSAWIEATQADFADRDRWK